MIWREHRLLGSSKAIRPNAFVPNTPDEDDELVEALSVVVEAFPVVVVS